MKENTLRRLLSSRFRWGSLHYMAVWDSEQLFIISVRLSLPSTSQPDHLPQMLPARKYKAVAQGFSTFITFYSLAGTKWLGFFYKPSYLSASLPTSLPLAGRNWMWHNALPGISDHAAVTASVCSHLPHTAQPTASCAASLLLPRWDIRSKCVFSCFI